MSCVPLAMAITALAGLILGTPTLRLRGDYLAIVTLGFGEIIRLLADNLADITNGPRGLQRGGLSAIGGERDGCPTACSPAGIPSGDANYGTWWFWLGIILMVGILLLVGNLERSRVGRAWVAIREDEDAAEVMGVNTFRFKLWAFVIGAAIGGLSGALYAGQVQFVAPPTFNIINSMLFLCAVVLGGQGNKLGVIFGAFIIVYLPNRLLGVEFLGINMGDLKYLFFGLALVVMMIFRPEGMFPARQQLLAYGKAARDMLRRAPTRRRRPHEHRGTGRVHREIHAAEGETLLQTKDLTVKFGGLVALDSVTFDIRRGEILGMIGPNGAGKTTCFNAITGVYRPTSGSVIFDGAPLGRIKRHQITRRGIARTFQNIRLWGEMTALENVMVGTDARHFTSVPGALVRTPRHRREETLGDRTRGGAAAFRRHRPPRRGEGQEPAVRRPAPAGDRPRIGHRAETAVPRRAGGRVQPQREGRADRPDPQDPRRRLHRAAHRARHAGGHGRHRPHRRAGVRPQDRRRPAARDPRGPEGHRRIPGGAR